MRQKRTLKNLNKYERESLRAGKDLIKFWGKGFPEDEKGSLDKLKELDRFLFYRVFGKSVFRKSGFVLGGTRYWDRLSRRMMTYLAVELVKRLRNSEKTLAKKLIEELRYFQSYVPAETFCCYVLKEVYKVVEKLDLKESEEFLEFRKGTFRNLDRKEVRYNKHGNPFTFPIVYNGDLSYVVNENILRCEGILPLSSFNPDWWESIIDPEPEEYSPPYRDHEGIPYKETDSLSLDMFIRDPNYEGIKIPKIQKFFE